MTDVVNKLWGFCNVLRHDGVDYGDYIEQLTYLLFLKMADERGVELPANTDWPYLRKHSGTELLDTYVEALRLLGKEPGILGDIFSNSQSRFSNPVNLQKLIGLIDETEWIALETDIKAAAFEGLLEKAASEGKKGAGQYFTPRLLIETVVRCVKPDPRVSKDFALTDPACGTGGFLVAAYEWLKAETSGGAFDRQTARRIRGATYFGQDFVARPRRLALMNLYLHQVEPHISVADSIYEVPGPKRYDVVLTNPPFGTKGANQAPGREDFVVQTSNKQLNFLQHVLTILKPGGRAAVVVPDNVLFAQQAAEVFEVLMEDCDVHTVLRCPRGTFSPYTEGTNTYVIFFTKGRPTAQTWIYDARANVPKVTKKERPLTAAHFAEFERCFGEDPNGLSRRSEDDCNSGRWRGFTIDKIKESHYKLDAFKWIPEDETHQVDSSDEPEELVTEAMGHLQLAMDGLADIQRLLTGDGAVAASIAGGSEEPLAEPHIAAARRSIGRFRQVVLDAACAGRLTDDWRETNRPERPAKPLGGRKPPKQLRDIKSYRLIDLPAEWIWVQIHDLLPVGGIFDGPFGSNLKSADYTDSGARVIRLENIGPLKFIDSKRTFVSSQKYASLLKHSVHSGDIVFSSFVDEQVRVCVLPPGLDSEALAKADCFTLRPSESVVTSEYLALQMACRRSYQSLVSDVHGATRPRVNTTQVRSLPIPLCSLAEQTEIVGRLGAMMTRLSALEPAS